jgi:hypothetical protein
MSDMDEQVKEMLRRKAVEVPAHGAMPNALARRARRRIAVNAVATSAVVLLAAAGVVAGVRALRDTGSSPIVVPPAASSTTSPTPTPQQVGSCAASQLRAVASTDGAAGSRIGAVAITNVSAVTCTLSGTPSITLLEQSSQPITSDVSLGTSPAAWQADASPTPPGWPVVTLAPRSAASFRIRWSNWCPQGRAVPTWQLTAPGGGTLAIDGFFAASAPPCNGPGMPSTIDVGPYEP